MYGFREDGIRPTVAALRSKGFYVKVLHYELYTAVNLFKYNTRLDWQCYRAVDGAIAQYPGVPFPARLFARLQEATIDGTKYLVPSPAEDYLQFKCGPEWRTPKQVGYEKDVLYEESLVPWCSHVYRPDSKRIEGRYFVLIEG